MTCAQEITFNFNNDGSITLTNPNPETASVNLVPDHVGFPVTIASMGQHTFTIQTPGSGAHCWQIESECGVVAGLEACVLVTPDSSRVFGPIIPEATSGTAPYTYSMTITLPEQGGRQITESGSGTGQQLGSHIYDRVSDNIPPDEVVIVSVTVTDSAGATNTDTFEYRP